MSITTATARDEMLSLFRTAWLANTPAVTGGPAPEVRWQGVESEAPPPAAAPWARVTVLHNPAAGGQRTFGEQAIYERLGLVTVEVRVPMSLNQGLALAEALAVVAREAFEGATTPGGVWFRNVRLAEVAQEDPWHRFNVVAEFTYEELR